MILHIQAPAGVDITANNEGFAIADASYTVDGQRPVYRFKDGEKSSAVESPKTGGNNALMFWGVILAVSALFAACFGKRKYLIEE